ncbi:cyclic-phosphate processing receiver domain-containing protein [Pirellulaceae bacterium SH467]
MLEDDRDRIERFSHVLGSAAIQFLCLRTAHDFIQAYESIRTVPELISLDHDLLVDHENEPDPGDGRDVAKFLALHKPISPILIHSTNAIAADSMLYTLEDAGWTVDRIAPIDDDWIESYWFPTALTLSRGHS